MRVPYRHRQIGTMIIAMTLFAEAAMTSVAWRGRNFIAFFLFSALLAFLGACFYALDVSVDDEAVRFRMGAGFFRKEIPLAEISSSSRVRNALWSGWGVKRTRDGQRWSFNVSGFDAVELTLKNSRIIRIGTDDPEGLLQAIRTRI
jgi:hypothetical protein